ncbi:MAG: hypothetical protein ACTSQ8_24505 [Candidatus Helarchaeota archaeon]
MKNLIILLFVFLAACSNNITGIYESKNAKTACRHFDVEEYILQAGHLKMSSQTQNPSIVNTSGSDAPWSNPSNIFVSDNFRASADISSGYSQTNYIVATGFNFTIPVGATIDGIEVAIERKSSPKGAQDSKIYLWTESGGIGHIVGDNKATSAFWPLSDSITSYGGSTDLWNAGFSVSDINDPGFGVAVRAQASTPCVAAIDNIYITIYYTESTTTVYENLTFGLSLGMSNTGDLGGTTVNESLTFGLSLGISESAPQTINESISIGLNLGLYTGNNLDDAGIRCISTANDIYIRDLDIASLTETWRKDYQINKYADGHNSIYHKSAWRKTWTLLIHANDIARIFVTALRSDQNNINLFPLYKFDKSTFYKTRVDNRAPLYYYAGEGDGSKLFQVVFYEVA